MSLINWIITCGTDFITIILPVSTNNIAFPLKVLYVKMLPWLPNKLITSQIHPFFAIKGFSLNYYPSIIPNWDWRLNRRPLKGSGVFIQHCHLLDNYKHYSTRLELPDQTIWCKHRETKDHTAKFFEVVAVFKWLTTQSPLLHCTNVSATEMTILFTKCLTFYTALNQMLKWNGLTYYLQMTNTVRMQHLSSCSFALLIYLKHKSSVPRLRTRN